MNIFFVRHAITQSNIDEIPYFHNDHFITEHGKLQAKETGKYLKKFGKFDLIISSPRLRTQDTANIIAKELNYKKKISLNNLITEEISKIYKNNEDIINSKSKEAMQDLFKNNATKHELLVIEKYKKSLFECNPFDNIKYTRELLDLTNKIKGKPSTDKLIKNSKKFLNYLKNLNILGNVLVVTHGGNIKNFQSIITNTIFCADIKIINKITDLQIYKYYNFENCCIMGSLFEKETKRFTLVIPSNTLHLQKLIELSSEAYKYINK